MGHDSSPDKLILVLEDFDSVNYLYVVIKAMNLLRSKDRHGDVIPYYKEATAGNYVHMMKVTRKWFEVQNANKK